MDLDVHGTAIPMAMLVLGIVLVRYTDLLQNARLAIDSVPGPVTNLLVAGILVLTLILVLHRHTS